ncbi:MAG TPA: hypothetical protein VGP25_12800 [Gemmatimonadaceae bacterium]|jgi:hypothetical protein|nr:hypothetical protein [Gemmatimonadaceae bacterium]
MGYRVFRDSRGVEWQAWDVVPQLTERRAIERRVQRSPVEMERRRAQERRLMHGRRPVLTAGLDGGWLCFENEQEKRRLAPIPGDWQRCDVRQLESYCLAAKRAPRPSTVAELNDIANILR